MESFPYTMNLETDSSGNSISLEHLKFEQIETKYDPHIDGEGHRDIQIRTSSNIITGFHVSLSLVIVRNIDLKPS